MPWRGFPFKADRPTQLERANGPDGPWGGWPGSISVHVGVRSGPPQRACL